MIEIARYPLNDNVFLKDPDQLHYLIICIECKTDLWEAKVLCRSGNQVKATESHPCDPGFPKFSSKNKWCPKCGKQFYGLADTGGHLYVIHDLKSGITRLI